MRHVFLETIKKAWHHRILGLSAETAFWQLLSLPSMALALLAALGFVSSELGSDALNEVEHEIVQAASSVVTATVIDNVVQPMLEQVLRGGRADIVSIGFIISLWAGSSAMATFVNTITIAYGMRDLRGPVRSRLLALWMYLVSLTVSIVLLPLLVIGPSHLIGLLPAGWRGTADGAIRIGYWPVLAGLLLLGLSALYHYATPIRLRWRRATPGAALAVAVFVAGAFLLREYFLLVVSKSGTYGALAAPIAALLFFYVLALAVLIGAELNATLERMWPRGTKKRLIDRTRQLWRRRNGNGNEPTEISLEPADQQPEDRQPGDAPLHTVSLISLRRLRRTGG